jgi:small subunit ribosomal protein S4
MGKPKFSRKKYETPSHPWKEDRINTENELIKKYGLKNKREIWKGETTLKKYRSQARELLAKIGSDDPQIKRESNQLLTHLTRLNILPLNSTLDDVLALETEAILSRRLQTITYLRGFANTPMHARQLISHGHIAINNRKITVPGYMVTKEEENEIGYIADSPLNDTMHPARPSSDFKLDIVKKIEEEVKLKETDKSKQKIKEDKTSEKMKDNKDDKSLNKPVDKHKPNKKQKSKKEKTNKSSKEKTLEIKEKRHEPVKKPDNKEDNKSEKSEKEEHNRERS